MREIVKSIGLRESHRAPGTEIGFVPLLLSTEAASSIQCERALPNLFADPEIVWRLLDEFNNECYRRYLEYRASRGYDGANAEDVRDICRGAKLGLGIAIATFALIREACTPTLYEPRVVPAQFDYVPADLNLGAHTPHKSNSIDYNNIVASIRAGFDRTLSSQARDGIWMGTNAGTIILAARHYELTTGELVSGLDPADYSLTEQEAKQPVAALS